MKANEFQECIRHLYCLYKKDFIKIFGEQIGSHLWNKFNEYNQNPAKWICYLDGANMHTLFDHLQQHLKKYEDTL